MVDDYKIMFVVGGPTIHHNVGRWHYCYAKVARVFGFVDGICASLLRSATGLSSVLPVYLQNIILQSA